MLKGSDPSIPELTKQVAQQAFPNGNLLMKMRDEFGTIFSDEAFADLYPSLRQPALSPIQLALVTLMQFLENLTDRQAACTRWNSHYSYSRPTMAPALDNNTKRLGIRSGRIITSTKLWL